MVKVAQYLDGLMIIFMIIAAALTGIKALFF